MAHIADYFGVSETCLYHNPAARAPRRCAHCKRRGEKLRWPARSTGQAPRDGCGGSGGGLPGGFDDTDPYDTMRRRPGAQRPAPLPPSAFLWNPGQVNAVRAPQVAVGGVAGITVEGVVKSYGEMQALGGIDLQVGPGEVLALLGPNGAGKSSLIRIIATAIIPDGGRVLLDGFDVVKDAQAARRKIGLVLADERSFFWRLSARKNMEFFASLHGMRRKQAGPSIDAALDAVDLLDISDRRVDRFSSGMRNRLAIARALLGNPTCLLLDEPTRSLDPSSSLTVRHLVRKLADERHVAVLIATHDLHEAAAISSQVHILVRGCIATRLSGGENAEGLEAALVAVTG